MVMVHERTYGNILSFNEGSVVDVWRGKATELFSGLSASQYWRGAIAQSQAQSRRALPLTMFADASGFDVVDRDPVEVVAFVESYRDEFEW